MQVSDQRRRTDDCIDPLNMSRWRKIIFIVLTSTCKIYPYPQTFPPSNSHNNAVSSLSLSLVSGFGGLLNFYIPTYAEKGATYADITALMTYPSMFMGIGCFFGTPLALAIGRRPVFLGSLLLLIGSAVLAAFAKTYEWHLGARMLLGLAAGQSEALVPMMIQVRSIFNMTYKFEWLLTTLTGDPLHPRTQHVPHVAIRSPNHPLSRLHPLRIPHRASHWPS